LSPFPPAHSFIIGPAVINIHYGVFLSGTSQQGPLSRRATSALSVPFTTILAKILDEAKLIHS